MEKRMSFRKIDGVENPVKPVEPIRSQFDNDEEYNDAMTAYHDLVREYEAQMADIAKAQANPAPEGGNADDVNNGPGATGWVNPDTVTGPSNWVNPDSVTGPGVTK